jgi:hypothetical protein
MIPHLAKRILLILAGYSLATIASGIVVGTVFYVFNGDASMNPFGLIAFAIVMIGIYAALPAFLFVAVGEAMALQFRLYYIAAACLIGMVLPVVVDLNHWYVLLGLGFGPVAGMIYWYIAGRRAGLQVPAIA